MNELIDLGIGAVAVWIAYLVIALLVKHIAAKWFDTKIKLGKINGTAGLIWCVAVILLAIFTWPDSEKEYGIDRKEVPVDVEVQEAPVVENVVENKAREVKEEATKASDDAMATAAELFNSTK